MITRLWSLGMLWHYSSKIKIRSSFLKFFNNKRRLFHGIIVRLELTKNSLNNFSTFRMLECSKTGKGDTNISIKRCVELKKNWGHLKLPFVDIIIYQCISIVMVAIYTKLQSNFKEKFAKMKYLYLMQTKPMQNVYLDIDYISIFFNISTA